jgi:hypothetical protein
VYTLLSDVRFPTKMVHKRSPVVMLGYETWRATFNGDASVVGRPLSIDGSLHTVIGVMPPKLRAFHRGARRSGCRCDSMSHSGTPPRRDVNALLRLRPGVSLEQGEGG